MDLERIKVRLRQCPFPRLQGNGFHPHRGPAG